MLRGYSLKSQANPSDGSPFDNYNFDDIKWMHWSNLVRFGQNTTNGRETIPGHECGENCLPGMKSTHINSWICFPLMSNSIRHLELCIHVKKPKVLPAALFTCEALKVLKLDVNLKAGQVPTTQPFRLPKLIKLHLRSVFIQKDNFVTSLVSSCPSLKYLDLECGGCMEIL